jgi:hypothetical protein
MAKNGGTPACIIWQDWWLDSLCNCAKKLGYHQFLFLLLFMGQYGGSVPPQEPHCIVISYLTNDGWLVIGFGVCFSHFFLFLKKKKEKEKY